MDTRYAEVLIGTIDPKHYDDVKVVNWMDEKESYLVYFAVMDKKTPLAAKIMYFLNNPKCRFRKVDWNFAYYPEKIVPQHWSWENKMADEAMALCGNGAEDSCWMWYYQAWYGQYYTLIYFPEQSNYQDFESIVKAIHGYFQMKISNGGEEFYN